MAHAEDSCGSAAAAPIHCPGTEGEGGEEDLRYARHAQSSLDVLGPCWELGKMAVRVWYQDGYVRALAFI